MSETVTLDDVWKAFLETDRRMRETDRKMRETDRKMRDADRKMREMLEESSRRIREEMREERRAERCEMDRVLKEVSRQIGQLGGRLGEFVEGLIRPACIALFRERGIPVDEVFSRVGKELAGEKMEIDLLVANTVAAIPIEVKSHLLVEDVRRHIERLERFKQFFPRYAQCRIYGAVAGIVIGAEADRFAMNQGLFVIVQSGETVRLANELDFTPKIW